MTTAEANVGPSPEGPTSHQPLEADVTETVTFISRCINQRLVIEPAYVRRDPQTNLPVAEWKV
jgi:hypothetical protein